MPCIFNGLYLQQQIETDYVSNILVVRNVDVGKANMEYYYKVRYSSMKTWD